MPTLRPAKIGCTTLAFACFLALMLVGPCSPLQAHLHRQAVDAFCATAQVFVSIEYWTMTRRCYRAGGSR